MRTTELRFLKHFFLTLNKTKYSHEDHSLFTKRILFLVVRLTIYIFKNSNIIVVE